MTRNQKQIRLTPAYTETIAPKRAKAQSEAPPTLLYRQAKALPQPSSLLTDQNRPKPGTAP